MESSILTNEIPFDEIFNGTTFPAYYCESNSVAGIVIDYGNLEEFVELPYEDITIKKALCRLGADNLTDCKIIVDLTQDVTEKYLRSSSPQM